MKFLKVEWTKKRGSIALMATGLVVSAFILGGYVATGNWNPWGNRHYYQVLNANFQECHTHVGGTPECQSSHNVLFNTGAQYVEKLVTSNNEGFCTVSATCSFNFIAMSSTATAPTAGQSSTGLTTATTSGERLRYQSQPRRRNFHRRHSPGWRHHSDNVDHNLDLELRRATHPAEED